MDKFHDSPNIHTYMSLHITDANRRQTCLHYYRLTQHIKKLQEEKEVLDEALKQDLETAQCGDTYELDEGLIKYVQFEKPKPVSGAKMLELVHHKLLAHPSTKPYAQEIIDAVREYLDESTDMTVVKYLRVTPYNK